MKRSFVLILSLLFFQSSPVLAERLEDWILRQIQADERLLADSLLQTGGCSFELLQHSKHYIPFFLELPDNFAFETNEQKETFNAWMKETSSSFLPGGYIFRLRFNSASPLYAMSIGDWQGAWRNLELGKDFVIEPGLVWEGSGSDYLYATMLAGVSPKLIVYDQCGEIKQKHVFDVTATDLEQRIDTSTKTYSQKSRPVLEMLSLSEYLENPKASWRVMDMSGIFNFRNQQQRDEEKEILKHFHPLKRKGSMDSLKAMLRQSGTTLVQPQSSENQPVSSVKNTGRSSMVQNEPISQSNWQAWVGWILGIAALAGTGWVLFKKKKNE